MWVLLKPVLPQLLRLPASPSVLPFQKLPKIQLKTAGCGEQQKLLFPSLEKLPASKSHIFVEVTNSSPFCFLLPHHCSIHSYYCCCMFRTDPVTSTLFLSPTCLQTLRKRKISRSSVAILPALQLSIRRE